MDNRSSRPILEIFHSRCRKLSEITRMLGTSPRFIMRSSRQERGSAHRGTRKSKKAGDFPGIDLVQDVAALTCMRLMRSRSLMPDYLARYILFAFTSIDLRIA